MRCASFLTEERESFGVLRGDEAFEATAEFRAVYPDMKTLLTAGALDELQANLEPNAAAAVRFLPPIPKPDKILCVGVNFRPHVEEMGRQVPEHPVVFVRFANSLVGHAADIVRPAASRQYDYEGELAIVIGRRARAVDAAEALACVAGYMPFFDGSVRDWQRHTSQFTPGKNFPCSGSAGPAFVTPDETGDPAALTLETRLNGEVMQEGCIEDLIFSVPDLVAYCSTFACLEPGDIIATGTPGGVGAARTPPRWLEPGDEVEIDIGKVGRLRNTVVAESPQAQ